MKFRDGLLLGVALMLTACLAALALAQHHGLLSPSPLGRECTHGLRLGPDFCVGSCGHEEAILNCSRLLQRGVEHLRWWRTWDATVVYRTIDE